MSSIINFAIRGCQIIFAAIILGLSVGLVRGQKEDLSSPISLKYAAFVGAVSFIAGIFGIAAEFVSALQGKISMIIDGLITLINIAGGVVRCTLVICTQSGYCLRHD